MCSLPCYFKKKRTYTKPANRNRIWFTGICAQFSRTYMYLEKWTTCQQQQKNASWNKHWCKGKSYSDCIFFDQKWVCVDDGLKKKLVKCRNYNKTLESNTYSEPYLRSKRQVCDCSQAGRAARMNTDDFIDTHRAEVRRQKSFIRTHVKPGNVHIYSAFYSSLLPEKIIILHFLLFLLSSSLKCDITNIWKILVCCFFKSGNWNNYYSE